MKTSPWQRRIERARELAALYPFAAEILGFYVHVARFQEDLHHRLQSLVPPGAAASPEQELAPAAVAELSSRFEAFLSLAAAHGPQPLAEVTRELRARGPDLWRELLSATWLEPASSDAQSLLAQAFLQPYAELVRSRFSPPPSPHLLVVCAFCHRKPGLGVLRQMGEGAARSLVCSFCLGEWGFRRLVCPACGEENDKRLPVFTAVDFDYIRVECCDACNTYIKTVDLTRNGRAEPIVDELASMPLDLWAREHGYAKLQHNLLGM
jgi:FdhE protein